MSILSIIIRREFIAKVRNKSFIVMTFLSPVLMVAIFSFVGYLASLKPDLKTIIINDETGLFVNEFKNSDEYKFLNQSDISIKILKDSILNESYEGLIFIPKQENPSFLENKVQYISNESPDLDFIDDIETIVANKITKENYKNIGLDTAAIRKGIAKVEIQLKKSSGETTVKGLNAIKVGIGGAFGYLIMMFIIIYGNMVMRSVIEEKTNRIIEIIISSVKPFTLMMGKIIGTSLAGVLQFLIWAILGGILFYVFSIFLGLEMGTTLAVKPEMTGIIQPNKMAIIQLYFTELLNIPIFTILFGFLFYFIGGYFLYSSIYAAIGAAVDNETDSQQFLLPIILPLILAVYVGFFSVLNEPHGTIATVFSMIPLTSPIVMLMRIPFGVPWWEILISLTILFGTFFFVVWFASKIYRVGILMYGKKPTWKELYRWLKY